MDPAYLHLLVNHFPVVLSVVGALAAVLSVFTRHRSTWTFGLASLLLAGIVVYPVLLTGQGAEDAMRNTWYVAREVVHDHEEVSELATWVMLGTAVLAAFALWRERTAFTGGRKTLAAPTWLRTLVALAALAAAGLLGLAAWKGGFIVHKSEKLRSAPAGAELAPTPATPAVTPPPVGTSTGAVDTGGVIRPPVR